MNVVLYIHNEYLFFYVRRIFMRILRELLAFFAAVSLFGCGSDGEKVREEGKLQVYTSFYCVYDFVSQIDRKSTRLNSSHM